MSEIKGCETPRIYTPARRELTPATTNGFAAIAFAETMMGLRLFPWQEWLLKHALELNEDGTYRYRYVIVLVGRQAGKAVSTNEPTLTTDGWKRMGDLQAGDWVFHPDGHPVEITHAFDPYISDDCYEVETTDGRKLTVDGDHLWTVKDVRRRIRKGRRNEREVTTHKWETLTTRELLGRGLLRGKRKDRPNGRPHREFAFRLPQQERIVTKPVELPIDPYVLGAWLGDGTAVSADLTVGDRDLDATRANLIEAGARIVSEKRTNTAWKLRFNYGGGMRDGFESRARRLGIWGNKHVPDIYLTAGTEQRAALLAGLLDSDGFIDPRKGRVEFCAVNERLADAALYLARSLGYRATKREGRAMLNGVDHGPKYRVCFTPSDYPFRLPRKNAHVKPIAGDRHAVSIRSITKVANREVRCIKVDRSDGLFLAGRDLVVTHNSLILLVLALWHLFAVGSKQVIATAQDLSRSEAAWKEAVEWCEEDEELSELIENVDRGHPKRMEIAADDEIPYKREYRVASAGRRGGRGFSGDLILMDELREHQTWETWSAITNAMNARPFGQAWAFSNAGDSRSIVLRYLRAQVHQRLGWPDGNADAEILGETDLEMEAFLKEAGALDMTGFFEWSAPPGASRRDVEAWAQSNPAMNCTDIVPNCVTSRVIAGALASNPPSEFETEVLCRWVTGADCGPFPEGSWEATESIAAAPAAGAKSVVCVAVNRGRTRAYIARAVRSEDGKPLVGIIADRAGTDWLTDWLKENRAKFECVYVQDKGAPVSTLIPEFESARTDDGRSLPIVSWPSTDVAPATGKMFDLLQEAAIYHLPHPGLDLAAATAMVKTLTRSAFEIDLVKSSCDAFPLQAAIGAVWALETVDALDPQIHEWPDDDEIRSWLEEEEPDY